MLDYWWITRPKRRLDCVCRELIAFHKVAVGKSWNANRSVQFEFEKMLETLNIKRHDSEKQSSGSSARTHATMLYSLGLWYEQDQCVHLTPAGAALVDGEPPVPILTHQVIHTAMSRKMDSVAIVPRSIRNVLFTRMRNVASNYLYKLRRLVPVSSMAADGDSEAEQAKAESSFWPCYAIDVLPHSHWESADAEGGGVVSLMPWADLERVVATNF